MVYRDKKLNIDITHLLNLTFFTGIFFLHFDALMCEPVDLRGCGFHLLAWNLALSSCKEIFHVHEG